MEFIIKYLQNSISAINDSHKNLNDFDVIDQKTILESINSLILDSQHRFFMLQKLQMTDTVFEDISNHYTLIIQDVEIAISALNDKLLSSQQIWSDLSLTINKINKLFVLFQQIETIN